MVPRIAILVAAAMALASAGAGSAAPQVSVSVAPDRASAEVGGEFDVRATIVNEGDRETVPLTAHIEIIDPTRAGSVDAEDWVPDLNSSVEPIGPGASREVNWRLKPIAGGSFAVYVVALSEAAGTAADQDVVASPAIPVEVREVRTLNAGGSLPVVIIIPLLLGAALVAVRVGPRWRRWGAGPAADGPRPE